MNKAKKGRSVKKRKAEIDVVIKSAQEEEKGRTSYKYKYASAIEVAWKEQSRGFRSHYKKQLLPEPWASAAKDVHLHLKSTLSSETLLKTVLLKLT